MNWKTLAVAAIPVCAVFAVQPSTPPPFAFPDITGIELLGCEIDIRKRSALSATTKTTIVAYDVDTTANTVEFTIAPESGVALDVGGSRGEDPKSVTPAQRNVFLITYDIASHKFEGQYWKHPNAAPAAPTATYSLPATGTFDPLGSVAEPYLEDLGEKTDATGERTARVWIDYFGARTAFTVADG